MLECTELKILRLDYEKLKTPAEREKQLKIISGHRKVCWICNGSYQTEGLRQLHEQVFAGTWGNGK